MSLSCTLNMPIRTFSTISSSSSSSGSSSFGSKGGSSSSKIVVVVVVVIMVLLKATVKDAQGSASRAVKPPHNSGF